MKVYRAEHPDFPRWEEKKSYSSKNNLNNAFIFIIVLAIIVLISQLSSATLSSTDPNLVSYWDANEISGSLNDTLGRNNMSIFGSPGYVQNNSCIRGGCVRVNGTGGASTAFSGFNTTTLSSIKYFQNWTLSFWATNNYHTDGYVQWFGMSNGTANYTTFQSNGAVNQTKMIANGNILGSVNASTNISHYAIVSQGASSRLLFYRNGVLKSNFSAQGSFNNMQLALGAPLGQTFSNPQHQYIDEIGLWNRTLDNSEILALAGNTSLGFYPFTLTDPSILFQGQTPSNATVQYVGTQSNITINTTVIYTGGTISQSHYLYNSSFSLIRQNNGTGANYTSNFTSLTADTYYFNASVTNTTFTNNTELRQINITSWNVIVNVTARDALTGAVINTFSGWIYDYETATNVTYNTTTGQALVQSRNGNITAFIDATSYSLISNVTLRGLNISTTEYSTYNLVFSLYATNTLNITFYNQATPTTILSGINITLDLISSLYANNYSTNNGTLYLTLLTPEDYTLRYTSTGFTTRFYTVSVSNRSFQSINLYLINSSVSTNLTITIIDEITDPVESAEVQILKYNLPINTYILQEIVTTGNDGTAVATVTFNNEYYKFIVIYNGEVKLTTVPEYITSTTKTLQISTGSSFGEEYFEYYNFYKDLTFNNNTNNFRLDYADGDAINSQVCMRVSRLNNFTITLLNTSCQTGASGTILLGVTAVNGTTYSAYAYFLDTYSTEYYLDSETYTYPSGSNVFGTYGLYLQWILTGSMALIGFAGIEFAVISIPVSLWIGNHLGLNQFSIAGINAAIVACLILFFVIILNKRRSA